MRRPPPNFKVERRTVRRSTQRPSDGDVALLDPPSMDDVPVRDVRSDDDYSERRSLSADESYQERARQDAERLFTKQVVPELPIDSVDIFPPLRSKLVAVAEAEPEPAAPVRRILQNTTWVDPLEQRIRDEEARRATRKPRQPREPKVREAKPPKEPLLSQGTRQRSAAIFDAQAEPELPFVTGDPAQIRTTPVRVSPDQLPPLEPRRRHPEPRILYNSWAYRQFLADARTKPREVAEIILKPGETWRRRMPVATWR